MRLRTNAALGLAALLLTAQAAPAQPASDRAVLDAFRSACARVDSLDNMREDARQGAWAEVADGADPRLEHINRYVREGTRPENRLTSANYRVDLAGRTIFLVVSRVDNTEGGWVNDCRFYDFDAAPMDSALLEAWMGHPPTAIDDLEDGGVQLGWEPGWRDGIVVTFSHASRGTTIAEALGYSGNVLTAQAHGGF